LLSCIYRKPMYHEYFGLRDEPFSASPDDRFFFQTEQHTEAVASLFYAILQRRGFGLLVGKPGLGKTSVLRRLVFLLVEGKADVAFLPQPYFDHQNILEAILTSLGIEPQGVPAKNYRLFYQYLMKTRAAGKTCVVIFDEAQNLDLSTLEAIRMLSNFETSGQKLIQIVLAGQPRLVEMLKQDASEQIRQRINVVARLHPLASYEVFDYVGHRLQIAGGSLGLFAPAALRAIASGSGGIPRNVNSICFSALSLAYALDRTEVGSAEVIESIRDLDLMSDDVHSEGAPTERSTPPARRDSSAAPASARDASQANADGPVHTRLSVIDQVLATMRRKASSHYE
jgi:general secretion pathway protein A